MRLRALVFVLIAGVGVGAAALRLGDAAAAYVEHGAHAEVAAGLAASGEDWAAAEADGLIVTLTGAAPDEARRLRAVEIVRQIVDPNRVRDATTLAAAAPIDPPGFALELMRNEGEVSLIGLAPEEAGQDEIARALASAGLDVAVSDMLESVAHPPPPGWEPALRFGLAALGSLPRAKISVTPGRVEVTALAESDDERETIEADLRARLPDGVRLASRITAPRPVIAPFRLDFTLDADGSRFAACTAETEADAAAIAGAAGLSPADCRLGLGAPSAEWPAAATAGVAAVRALEGGRFALTDGQAVLTGPDDAAPERLEAAAAQLRAALPTPFSLRVIAPAAPTPPAAAEPPPAATPAPRFEAVLEPGGAVRLAGSVRDATARDAIASFAAALFGHERIIDATMVAPDLPEGWPGRVLAGVEALSLLKEGALAITPEGASLDGWAIGADGEAKARALFASRQVPARVALRFDAAAAAAEAEARARAENPAGACRDAIQAVLAAAPISFAPGAATLDPGAEPAMAALASALADCPPVDFEIAGHTDAQGDPERNLALSRDRAAAVKAALDAAGLPHVAFVARGYGAERPVADNDTEEGRAANRRIEFTLIDDEAAAAQASAPAAASTGEEPGADGPY